MKARERIMAAFSGEPLDRPAFSLWRHFHDRDATPEGLVAATLEFVRRWQPDFVKHTPVGMYGVEDWGVELERYDDPHRAPERRAPAFQTPAGWHELVPLDASGGRAGALGRELRGLRRLRQELDPEVPILMTIFSPLTLAYKLVGDRLVEDLRAAPEALHAGLRTIAGTTARYTEVVGEAGADGIFFASQFSTSDWITRGEYAIFGEPYDRQVLDAWSKEGPVVLHLHGTNIFFDLANRYPVDGVSWHDRETAPTLAEALELTERTLVAGLDRTTFLNGPEVMHRQAREALTTTDGRRHVLAPSCVIPTQVADETLAAVVAVVHQWS